MNITSNNTMIFAKEFEGKIHYRAGLSSKKQDGSYDKTYIDVKFPKGKEVADKTKIDIIKGFLSFYNVTNKENKKHTYWYIVVQEFATSIEFKETQEETDPFEKFGNQITVEDLDNDNQLVLPF